MALLAIGLLVAAFLVIAPLAGWPPLVRLSAVAVPAGVLALISVKPWRWDERAWLEAEDWIPSRRARAAGLLALGALLSWLVLTRFQSGSINAVDFTVYFDRPCFQTLQGRPLLIETADIPSLSWRSALTIHAYWGMIPLCFIYAVVASPYWLLALSVFVVVAGAVHVWRITTTLGDGGVLAVTTALAFALNDNTARTLNYGFHPEVLYAWFVPWLLDAGLRAKRLSFAAAALACIAVKEDACMFLFAASVVLALYRFREMRRADAGFYLIAPTGMALLNLAICYGCFLPWLAPDGPVYTSFWANYGQTPMEALLGMTRNPMSVLEHTLTSGFLVTVLPPHLFLPIVGWRWMLAIAPVVLIYGASANEQLRAFEIYYSMPLVPFLVIGASTGALAIVRHVPRRSRYELAAAAILLLAALVVGFGYSLRPWRPEFAAIPDALARLTDEKTVLVQSGLYPSTGYEPRVQLLSPETLESPRYSGAGILLAPSISAYPFQDADLDSLYELPPIRPMPAGLRAVRRPPARTP